MAQRIKGQEVELLLVSNGQPLTTIQTIRSFEFAFKTEILSEGYLGETTERQDSIFKGVRGRMEMHTDNEDILALFFAIVDKARRRVPGAIINIKATLNYPNGQRPRMLFPDVEFGELPFNFASRADYGAITLEFACQEARRIGA